MKTKKAKILEAKKQKAFYSALFEGSFVHGVREGVIRELIKANRELVELKPAKTTGKDITLTEDISTYISYLLKRKELQTKLQILSKVLIYEEN